MRNLLIVTSFLMLLTPFTAGADASFNTVPLPADDQLPPAIQQKLKQLPPINVFRMVANVPQTFIPFVDMATSLLKDGKFNPKLREMAILRVAYLTNAPYEWHQHSFIAKANGVTEQEMNIIRTENPVHSLNEEENFICNVTDELTKNANLTDATFKKLYGRYDTERATEIIYDISFFNMLSRFLNGTRVQIEPTNPLAGHTSPVN